MSQKTIIVTGANSGIGFQACSMLAREGHEVILACRSEEKGNAAVGAIKRSQPGANVLFMKLDVSSLKSVRSFVTAFQNTGKPLDVLVCNAGISYFFSKGNQRRVTEDGFEDHMGTNHLGHMLLTILLLDNLKAVATEKGEARVVSTASVVHDNEKVPRVAGIDLDVDDINLEKPGAYTGKAGYKNSKLANVIFTMELAERLKGTGVIVNCFCPGLIPSTNLFRHAAAFFRCFVGCCSCCLVTCGPFSTPQQGGRRLIQLATGEEIRGTTGKYYQNGEDTVPSAEARDEGKRKKFWDASVRSLGLGSEELSKHFKY